MGVIDSEMDTVDERVTMPEYVIIELPLLRIVSVLELDMLTVPLTLFVIVLETEGLGEDLTVLLFVLELLLDAVLLFELRVLRVETIVCVVERLELLDIVEDTDTELDALAELDTDKEFEADNESIED